MKRFFFIILFLSLILGNFAFAQARDVAEEPLDDSTEKIVEINFFFSPTCIHCAQEKEFLNVLEEKYPQVTVNRFNIFDSKNVALLKSFHQEYEVSSEDRKWVPITFTQNNYFLGFNEAIAQAIDACIKDCIAGRSEEQGVKDKISLPFIGEVNIAKFSPLGMAAVLGAFDGFNACAMVALGFLIALLVATGVRKRIILIGGTFIFVSGLVYFLFMAAWLNLFVVLERIAFITYLVAAIIIIFAAFMLKDYFVGAICKLCNIDPSKDNIFTKMERVLFGKMQHILKSGLSLPLTLLGVALVAAGINMLELVCSFGFPLAFTKALTASGIPRPHYYFYIFVYVFFYMLDDFLIFLVAVWTLKITGVSEKYLKAIKLISGIVLLILGLIMLFRPELLSFTLN